MLDITGLKFGLGSAAASRPCCCRNFTRSRCFSAPTVSQGLASTDPVREGSGKTKKAGSQLCRKALWQWCLTRLEVSRHLRNEVGNQLHSFLAAQKDNGVPTKLARSRTTAKAVRMLFKALVKELGPFADR